MNLDFLPTLLWLIVVASGVFLLIDAENNREGVRLVVQAIVGVLLVLAFVANLWTSFSHWAYCSDNPYAAQCEEDEEDEEDDFG